MENFADETLPSRTARDLHHLCRREARENLTVGVADLTTGTMAGRDPETVSPLAAVLHQVKARRQEAVTVLSRLPSLRRAHHVTAT